MCLLLMHAHAVWMYESGKCVKMKGNEWSVVSMTAMLTWLIWHWETFEMLEIKFLVFIHTNHTIIPYFDAENKEPFWFGNHSTLIKYDCFWVEWWRLNLFRVRELPILRCGWWRGRGSITWKWAEAKPNLWDFLRHSLKELTNSKAPSMDSWLEEANETTCSITDGEFSSRCQANNLQVTIGTFVAVRRMPLPCTYVSFL